MITIKEYIILSTLLLPFLVCGQTASVLQEGSWYKIGVVEKGVYQLDHEFLKQHGVPVESIDPGTFQVYGNGGGGALPQPNDAERPTDLIENAIVVEAGNDGSFDEGDYIRFFGNTPDKVYLDSDRKAFTYEDNIYSDTVFYFLTWGQSTGRRMVPIDLPVGEVVEEQFIYHYTVHDVNEFNLLNSGRLWLGENFDRSGRSIAVRLKVPLLSSTATQLLQGSVMGASLAPADFIFDIDGSGLGAITTPQRPEPGSYTRGFWAETIFQVPNATVGAQPVINVRFETAHADGFGFLDYLLLTTRSELIWSGTPFAFTTDQLSQSASFTISGYQHELLLWDISDPVSPSNIPVGDAGKFTVAAGDVRDCFLFAPEHVRVPVGFRSIPNQNLRSLSNIEFLIITVPAFAQQAERLGEHRLGHSGFTYRVVVTGDIYNEFSSGAQDITAIRDFIRHLSGQGDLKYVLLFGDGSYDYKDRTPDNTNLVPTYQSRNSLDRTQTYASDDYYGFLDDDEGQWGELIPDEPTLDVSIGRIPAKTPVEAEIAVDKVIHYDQLSDFGKWRSQALFVADDGDENLHHRDTDLLTEFVDRNYGQIAMDKLYLDAYPQKNQFSEAAHQALERAVHQGALVIDYMGHGNELQLAHERLVADFDIRLWRNLDRLPFLVTATCEFGVFDNPAWFSAGERLILEPKGGAIGLITATRLVYTNSNFQLNSALTQEIFKKEETGYPTISDVFRRVKNRSLAGINNRNYVLLGDPTVTLKYPEYEVRIDSVLDLADQPITAFESFMEAKVHGSIYDHSGDLKTDFNGEVNLAFYDQLTQESTLGDENEPFSYRDRNSLLFQGRSSVNGGKFTMSLLLPDGITTTTSEGKIVLYASDTASLQDASGGLTNVAVTQAGNSPLDMDPPEITVFVGDTLFKSGDRVSQNSQLVVHLKDASGINLSTRKPEEVLRGELNGAEIRLNEYYTTDLDTYQLGRVNYQFRKLSPGTYTFTMYGSDITGNSTSETVKFRVLSSDKLPVNDFKAFPNPSAGDVHFSFVHDREEEELYVEYEIFNLLGKSVFRSSETVADAPATIETTRWRLQDQLRRGIDSGFYLYRFHIRSLKDGASANLSGRVILR